MPKKRARPKAKTAVRDINQLPFTIPTPTPPSKWSRIERRGRKRKGHQFTPVYPETLFPAPDARTPKPSEPIPHPTKYRPEMCAVAVDLGRRGWSLATIAKACDVSTNTLHAWRKRYPEFGDAIHRSIDLARAWWEEQGQAGIWSKDFNASAYRLQVTNRFPEHWKDRQEVDSRTLTANIDLARLSDDQLKRVRNGEPLWSVLAPPEASPLALPTGQNDPVD